jgi:hypothetical protein
MNKNNRRQAIATERLEDKYQSKGLFDGAVSFNPMDGFIYLGDARDYLDSDNRIINVDLLKKSQVLGASGHANPDQTKGVYTNTYLQMMANYKRMLEIKKKIPSKSLSKIGEKILGAAGPTATADYQAIRRTGDLLTQVLGQEHTNEDYQAINVAEVVNKDSVKFEYIKRTSARIIAQKGIPDDVEALPLKHVYTTGTKEIFAYGLSFSVSMRDIIDTKTDIVADFMKQVPDAFLAAKNEDVVTLLNAISGGTNQGDWDSFSSGIAAVNAANQVQTAEAAVKAYGSPLVCILDTTSLNGYLQNLQGAYFQGQQQNIAAQSRATAPTKSGILPGNPGVTYYVDDAITAATYALAAKSGYMKHFQAMTINTEYKNPRTPGQAVQKFMYEFAGFEEANTSAVFHGESVLS